MQSSTETPDSSRTKPSLLNIPAELRNNIYELALTSEHDIVIQVGGAKRPALLHACKQTREEATKIYFSQNDFRMSVDEATVSTLRN